MQRTLLLAVTFSIFLQPAFAQSDTSYMFFNKEGKETTKDSADTYAKFYKASNGWHGQTFYSKNNILKSEGDFAGRNYNKPLGSFKNYKDDGTLDFTAEYDAGRAIEKTWYYKNGNKKSNITYTGKGVSQQKGWDEAGKEIKDYVVEKEARFKGGPEGWRRFLEKTLNASIAAESGAPVGNHTVKVQFIVSKEGYVSNVKAITTPPGCKACAKEAVAVLTMSPPWEPAVQNDVPVIYQAIQYITFQVAEERTRRKRGDD